MTVTVNFKEVKPDTPDDPTPSKPEFTDVPANVWYADAVAWAVDRNIPTGKTDTQFGPEEDCTRGQIVTFLWRAAGEPAPTSSENPFVDVPEGAYYYKAVLWAVEKGITAGTSETTFSPEKTCTRSPPCFTKPWWVKIWPPTPALRTVLMAGR